MGSPISARQRLLGPPKLSREGSRGGNRIQTLKARRPKTKSHGTFMVTATGYVRHRIAITEW